MKVIFLGGASGIGASCVAVQIGEQWVLVDAGIRMDPNADRLPDLSVLQDKPLAAIFVTHAHADHIGALPLVHQSFPTVPIYASRATMLIMEVMLNDALQIMAKRAATEFEVPLYDETMVTSMLHYLRPLPMTGTLSIAELPNVTIHTARAGHVAGAVSIGFEAPDGRLLISGDVSVTPQHTIPGAHLSTLRHPDLFILESTYGARLHPNRQTEEERLAQTVAEGIARGGHVLIPAFALGRAQEVLRILHMAQRRGQIPEFPVWVDGLVRKVCTTYTAIPNALSPALQRQIHKGYPVFFTGMIRSVTDARQRERIIQGPPSCIVSSSGMLTGGPSAFYASHLAENPNASILITGYQDDEAPGRKLLALADKETKTLELNEKTVTVHCRVDRYHLSAHADGNELTAMVSALKARRVALVHGDPESRVALQQRLERLTDAFLASEAHPIEIETRGKKGKKTVQPAQVAQTAVTNTQPLTEDSLEALWLAVRDGSGTQIISVRELALAWYGISAGADEESHVQQVLEQSAQNNPPVRHYFVPMPELPGLYRVRAPEAQEEVTQSSTTRSVQPGKVVLLQAYGEKLSPAVCFDTRGEAIWAYLSASEGSRTRFPRTAVLELVGSWQPYPITDVSATRQKLADMVKAAQRWQRQHPPRAIVEMMQLGKAYEYEDILTLFQVGEEDLVARLAVALMLNDTPRLFIRQQEVVYPMHRTRYLLSEEWKHALEEGAGDIRPDQMWILSVLEKHIGSPTDLYRRSVNPDTGEVTLSFHFPAISREKYKDALQKVSEEAGVPITIAPQPHQGALTDAAHAILPTGLTVTKTSLHHDQEVIRLRCSGSADKDAIVAAVNQFQQQTGWSLDIEYETPPGEPPQPALAGEQPAKQLKPRNNRLDLHSAMALTRAILRNEPDFYKVSADQSQGMLTVRFHFPDMAGKRCESSLKDIEEQTGWYVTVYPEPHQGAMEGLVRRLIPDNLEIVGAPSLYRKHHQVVVKVRGNVDQEAANSMKETFSATTGWTLEFQQM
jgi:Cft2 family RNA processing exonuclease